MRTLVLIVATALLLPALALGAPLPANPLDLLLPHDLVIVEALSYVDPVTYVYAGQPVTWDNSEFLPGFATAHTVTADDGSFDSGPMPFHGTFVHVFDLPPGTVVQYHCRLYDFMHGAMVVL
jgi:hypothetical protein